MRLPTKSGLASWSHIELFMNCPRKFAWRHIDRIESNFQESPALIRGRLFHKAVELDNPSIADTATDADNETKILCKIAARKYLELKKDFPVPFKKEAKIINEREGFIGFCDEFYVNEDNGKWKLGEMKTTAYFEAMRFQLASLSHQTALYKGMADQFCADNWIDKNDFDGMFHRTIVFPRIKRLKGRGKNAVPETDEQYAARAEDKVAIMHQTVTFSDDVVNDAMFNFRYIRDAILHLGQNSNAYPKNSCACLHPRFGLCEYIETCQSVKLSLTDDEEGDIDYSESI